MKTLCGVVVQLSVWVAVMPGLSATVDGATYDVTAYGARADDDKDDWSAIADAIDDCGPGDTVYIPKGTFDVSNTVTLKADMVFAGVGRDDTVLRFIGEGAQRSVIVGREVSNVEIHSMTVDGNDNGWAFHGILITTPVGTLQSNINIHDTRVRDLPGSGDASDWGPFGIYFHGGINDSRVVNNEIRNIGLAAEGGKGKGIEVNQSSCRNLIEGNTIANTARSGISCQNHSSGQVIRGNTITGTGQSFPGDGTDTAGGLSIELHTASGHCVVEDNVVDHWISVATSDYVAVRRNTVSDKGGVLKFCGLELAQSKYCVFTHNVIDGGQLAGMSISGVTVSKGSSYIAHNTFRDSQAMGVSITTVNADHKRAEKIYFYDNTVDGTEANHPLYPALGHGVRILATGRVREIVFDGNAITGSAKDAVRVDGSDVDRLVVTGNRIADNGGKAYGGTVPANLLWDDNTVTGNGDNSQPAGAGFAGNAPPEVTIRPPAAVSAGTPVEFAMDFRDDGTMAFCLWDFGDGLPSTDVSPQHTFSQEGQYEIALIAWDDGGRSVRATVAIDVAPRPVEVTAWQVVSRHGDATILIDAPDGYVHAPLTGLSTVRLTLSHPVDPATLSADCFRVIGQASGDRSTQIASVAASQDRLSVDMAFDPPLPDADRYSITVLPALKSDAGEPYGGATQRTIGCLAGDANGSQEVTSADVVATRKAAGNNVDPASARYDMDGSGTITGADLLPIKSRLGNALPQ